MKKFDVVSVSKENRIKGITAHTTAAAKAFKRTVDVETLREMLIDELNVRDTFTCGKDFVVDRGIIDKATAVFTDVYFDYMAMVEIRFERKYYGIIDVTMFLNVNYDGEHVAISRFADSTFTYYKFDNDIVF